MGDRKTQVRRQLSCLYKTFLLWLGQQEAQMAQLFLFLKPCCCLAYFLLLSTASFTAEASSSMSRGFSTYPKAFSLIAAFRYSLSE